MFYLEDAEISGFKDDIACVKRSFGNVYLGDVCDGNKDIHFMLQKFNNWYKDSSGSPPPLFVLIPSKPISSVWPGQARDYDEIKYGTSDIGTSSLVLHLRNRIGLLICLTPEGKNLEDGNSFGI